ncbi:histone-like nucleoid-structuring protein Lsr2 [Nocardia asteroides]|uniref:histone-like nucleoid-structuring protein Lsr2 n=1 Tax=Nocardia asteroides TaxID=1824 RepID=UPI001E648E7E|nr:Lsr2 family protein [Nocardia asteroides]UGT64413.1 Lsr2 family protein [Nocardia asteroides]
MARKVTVELVDDFDGKSTAEETVSFALEGVQYEIDLSTDNAKQLRGLFDQWSPHARRVGRAPKSKSIARSSGDREKTQAIRDWARANGIEVSSRGRVAAEVVDAYTQATAEQ